MSRTAIEAARAWVADKDYADKLDRRCGDVLTKDLPTAGYDAVFVQAAIRNFGKTDEMYALRSSS